VRPSSGIPPRSHSYLSLESLFTIPRASEMKIGTKSGLLPSHPPWEVYWYKCSKLNQNIKNRKMIYTLPPSASHTFLCLGPNWPISTLSSDSSTNADCAHVVLSRFIVSPAHHPYFLELTCSSPNPVLDARLAGYKPVPLCSYHRPYLCSGGACYCAYWRGLGVFGPLHCSYCHKLHSDVSPQIMGLF